MRSLFAATVTAVVVASSGCASAPPVTPAPSEAHCPLAPRPISMRSPGGRADPAPRRPARAADPGERDEPGLASDETDDRPDGLSLGSRPGERLRLGVMAWPAELKSRSHFGFEGGSATRDGELAFVNDLGLPSRVIALGAAVRLSLGELGSVSLEGFGFTQGETFASLRRARTANGIELRPGDRLDSEAWALSTDLRYGYEVRARIHLTPNIPVELYASPTLGVGLLYFDARVRRLAPDPTPLLGGHASVWAVAPGARLGFEVLDTFEVGADVVWGMPQLAVAAPGYTTWQRLRLFVGIHVLDVELTVGWRLSVTHATGDGKAGDIRLRGLDATLGVRF